MTHPLTILPVRCYGLWLWYFFTKCNKCGKLLIQWFSDSSTFRININRHRWKVLFWHKSMSKLHTIYEVFTVMTQISHLKNEKKKHFLKYISTIDKVFLCGVVVTNYKPEVMCEDTHEYRQCKVPTMLHHLCRSMDLITSSRCPKHITF